MRIAIIIALFGPYSCTDKDEISVPGGSSTIQQGNNENNDNSPNTCPDEWTLQNGTYIDPVNCLTWSPLEKEIDWYEAVNPEQATEGGCTENCDKSDRNYCADLNFGNISSWRLPSIDELEDISMRSPPFEDPMNELDTEGLDADLWSYNSDAFDGLALTVNLAQAGFFIALEKDTLAAVRCVAD